MKKRIISIILLLLVFYGIFAIVTFIFAKRAITTSQKAAGAIKLQDLDATKAYLKDAKREFKVVDKVLIVYTPFRIVPLVGWYVADAQRGVEALISGLEAAQKFTDAITPYADVLGLEGEGTFLGGTAQERLAKALETLSKVTPQIDEVGKSLGNSREQVEKIATWRYPDFLPSKPGTKIAKAKDTIIQLETFIVDTKPLLVVLPQIMGQSQEKKYLVLFQNDKELRPTGGFITAYAFFRVQKGVITSEGSEDIYSLDGSLTKKLPAPPAIIKYLPNVPYLNLRDSNVSPDFYASVKQFESLYQFTSGKKDIDGIIALDTEFVLDLVRILGPIDAYGSKFTANDVEACACPQIIYELERYADEPTAYEKGARKDILGVLMLKIMDLAFNAPKSSWPNLLGTGITNLREKHLLLYFKDNELQEAVERINFAGRLYEYDGDYLHINEANFAGAKSNLYIEEKVKQQVKKGKDGQIEKKVTIEYKYPRRGDNCSLERKGGLCLAGIYRDYIRIYTPLGSNLTKSTGAEVALTSSEDLGKTVFEGFFTIRPEGTAKIELEYTVPLIVGSQYRLLIQKQPGTMGHNYEVEAFGKKQRTFPLTVDKELIFKL